MNLPALEHSPAGRGTAARGTMRPMTPGPATLVHAPAYECDIGPHVFPTAKYRLVLAKLAAEGFVAAADVIEPARPNRATLELVQLHLRLTLDAHEGARPPAENEERMMGDGALRHDRLAGAIVLQPGVAHQRRAFFMLIGRIEPRPHMRRGIDAAEARC